MIEINVVGHIKPISQTKLRVEHSTYSNDLGSYPAGAVVEIDRVAIRDETVQGKPHDYEGDMWGRVVAIDGKAVSGWMAIQYHHTTTFAPIQICTRHYEPSGSSEEPPVPTPIPTVPPFAFHLNYHSGEWTVWFNGKEYVPKESA